MRISDRQLNVLMWVMIGGLLLASVAYIAEALKGSV